MAEQDKLLRTLANAIHDLAVTINSNNPRLKVSDVVQFCRICTPAFFLFGIAFKFADLEVQNKVYVKLYNLIMSSIYLLQQGFLVCTMVFFSLFSNALLTNSAAICKYNQR